MRIRQPLSARLAFQHAHITSAEQHHDTKPGSPWLRRMAPIVYSLKLSYDGSRLLNQALQLQANILVILDMQFDSVPHVALLLGCLYIVQCRHR